jgi:hypothetical protein
MICLVFVLYPWKSYVQNAWRELTETGVGALIALILFAAGLKRVSTGLPVLSRRGLRIRAPVGSNPLQILIFTYFISGQYRISF